MTEGGFEGVEGVKIFPREWQPAGEPRGMVVISPGLNAHSGLYEWAAIPSLPRPQALNIRKAFYGLIAITSLGLAPAMPIAAASPAPVSISRDEVVSWLADGERGLWIQVNTLDWFYARFASGCHGIGKTNSMVLETDASGHVGGISSVNMPGGTQCRLRSLAPSLWIQVKTLDWYYARFASGCRGISETNSIVFETDASGHIDGRSAVAMPGGTRCRLHRLALSSGPPKNRNADVVPRPQDQG